MPYARHLQVATLDFMIGNPDPLPRPDALLAMAAAMTADGHVAETANVLSYVLREYPDPEHVREVIIQTHLFAGYPRALNGLEALDQAADKIGFDRTKFRNQPLEPSTPTPDLISRGQKLWDMIYAANAAKVARRAASLSPDLGHWSILHGYGTVLTRPGPTALQREFCVVAALIPMDAQPQLKGHVQGCLNLGANGDQMWKLLGVVKTLFEAPKLVDAASRTFEAVLGKKASDLSFEEEHRLRWS
jgi:4-carboxymuconolactone decarboxylase